MIANTENACVKVKQRAVKKNNDSIFKIDVNTE
jgi:hypothetical protein